MKRQRAALGMAVMMAVSSLCGSYVSASAMETWQADAMILEEELAAEEILEEAEPTPGAEEVPETGVTTETEAETGAAIDGMDGLQITGIEELTPEEADQFTKIELQGEEGEENSGEIEPEAELEGFPGDESLLPGWGYSINSEYALRVRNEDYPDGEVVRAQITGVWIDDPDGLFQYERWQGEDNASDETTHSGVRLQPDDDGNYYVEVNDEGRTGEATLTSCYVNETEGVCGYKTVNLYAVASRYDAGYEFSAGTYKLLPGEKMDITTSLNHRWYIQEENREEEEPVKDYTILLGNEEGGTGTTWSSNTIDVSVDEEDGTTLHVTAKSLDDIVEADRWSNIPVRYYLINGEEREEVAYAEIGVVVWEDYYQIIANTLEIENPMLDGIVDFSALGISTEHYYLPNEPKEEIAVQNIRYLLEYDTNAWEAVTEAETHVPTEEDAKEPEQYGLLKLKRTGNWDTTVTVIAQHYIDEEENAHWDEVDRLEYQFDQIDYNSWFDFHYGDANGSDILLYGGDGSESLTVSLNWDEMNHLKVDKEDIEWTVKVFEGESENGDLAVYGINAAVAEDGKSVTLTAENRERSDIALWVGAKISRYGNELTRPNCDIPVAKVEFDVDSLPGDDERLVPGWPYGIDPEYQIYVRDLQHPWGEEIPIAITEAWIQDKEGAFEYTPEEDENGKIIQSEYGVKLQKEDGYHLRAKQDWTKVPEGSATLTYSYALRRDPDDNTNDPEQYSGKKSVQLGVITERYDHSYRFEDGREELLPGDEAYIDTTLYYTRYDVDAGDYQEDKIENYAVTLQQNEDGSSAWKDELVDVSIEGTRIKVKASEKCNDWYETWIPVDYRIGDDIVYSDSIWVAISSDYYVITPERLLTEPDELGESVQMNPLVGETIDFAELDVTAWHYHRTEQGSSAEEINVDGAQFRYRMEYDSEAWTVEGELSEEEKANGYLIGLRTLRRIKNGEAPVRIILEEHVEDEESGEWKWEERIGKDYWFFEADYMPALSFYYGNSETYDPYIYTEGNGLTLTFDSIASELLKAPENSKEGGKVYSLEWNVYDLDENGEQTEEYIATSTSKDGNSITLKGKGGIDQHKGARFQVEAILRAYDEEVARTGTEICVTGSQYRFVSEQFTDSDIYLIAGLQEQESARYFQKDSDGKVRLELYRKDENCPDGQLDTVLLSQIEFANREDAEKDIVHIEALEDGFKVSGGQNPGKVELKFSITDEKGNSLAPVHCIAHVRTEYTAIGDWFIDSPTHAGTNLLPGQQMTIKMDVYRGGIDENGTFYERKMAEDEYNVEFCDYDPDIIQIEDGVVYAKKRGETWVGVQIKDATTGHVICSEGIQVCVKGKFYSMEPVDIGTIILAPGDEAVDIPLSTIKWSISNPNGEKETEELIYFLPEEANKRQDGFTTGIREENGETILRLEFAKDSSLAKGESAWQAIQINCSMGDDIIAQRVYNVLLCNHVGKELARTEATCTTAGKTAGSHCSVCNKVLEAQQTIPATGHSLVTDAAVAATCTTTGKTAGSHCSVCNTVLEAQQTIPATGHSLVTDAAVAATCTTAGKTAGSHCSVCNKVLEAQQMIPATGHSWSAWKMVSEATILAAAVQERSCTTCGTTQRQNAGSALSPKLTLNATSITLKTKQKTKKIQVTGLAAGDAVDSWISSDEKVVKVSGTASGTCTITAQKKTGNATIYVKLKSGLTGTIQVKVQKKRVAATKVVVAEKTVKLQKGQKQKIHAYIQPLTTEDKLTFTSSNKKVAAVSKDGTITAKKAGKANITVKAGKKKVTVKVTVQAPAPTGINGVPATKTLKKGKSFTIKPKLIPSGAEAKITYSSSNKKVATVNAKGKVTAKRKGTAVITVRAGSIVRTCEIIVK